MIRKRIAVAFVCGIVVCACRLDVEAQNCETQVICGNYNQWNALCEPLPPANGQNWHSAGPFSSAANAKNASCPAQPETHCCAGVGDPVDSATGDTYFAETDLQLPGIGGGFRLVRTWNSLWPVIESASKTGMFGQKWRSNFEESILVGSDGYMKYSMGDGNFWSFGFTGQANNTDIFAPNAPANKVATLIQSTTNWTLTFQNGEQRVFDINSGNLLSITDRNGNVTTLTYDPSFRLVTVTDPASRHLYFSYASPTSYLVTGVTSDVGISLSYSYDTLGRLIQYTKPDNTTVSFQYNDPNPNLITAVLDSNGKVLESHTYNSCGQGLTSARAGGVDAVTVSYPPCSTGASFFAP
jgi:YD repeat-containing protein